MKNLHQIKPIWTDQELGAIWYLINYNGAKLKITKDKTWYYSFDSQYWTKYNYLATDIQLWLDKGKPTPSMEKLIIGW